MKIGFIGCGNMGGALALAASQNRGNTLLLSDHNDEKRADLARRTGGAESTNREIMLTCDIVFLGVKPQFASALFDEIRPLIASRDNAPLLVSMLAGVRTEKILALAGRDIPLIRIMPNTPVAVGAGMILYTVTPLVTEDAEKAFLDAMSAAGLFDRLDEDLIDAGCAVSGCGPAFMFAFARAVAEGGIEAGLSPEKAYRYAEQTMKGAAMLALSSDKPLEELIRNVCSPGGSTIEGVKILESGTFDEVVKSAVGASFRRTVELGK